MCVLAIPEAQFPDDMACECPGPPRSAGALCPLDEAPCPGTVLWEQRLCGSGLVNPPSCCPGSCPILLGPRLLDMTLQCFHLQTLCFGSWFQRALRKLDHPLGLDEAVR